MNNISIDLTSLQQSQAAENANFETIQNPEYIAPQLSDTKARWSVTRIFSSFPAAQQVISSQFPIMRISRGLKQ